MNKKVFSIGEMAQLFHLSVSSIRHYESRGLLTPEYVDPDTGYRYYSPRQFELFNTIRYFRALGMPLSDIEDFLHNREVGKMEEKLSRQKAIVAEKQRELARIERKIDAQMQRLRDAQSAELGCIELVSVPACRIFWTENHTTARFSPCQRCFASAFVSAGTIFSLLSNIESWNGLYRSIIFKFAAFPAK